MSRVTNLIPGPGARAINKTHRLQVKQFLLSVGYSFAEPVRDWIGTSATYRLLRDMVEDGLIRTEAVWALRDKDAYMLTAAGLAAVCESLAEEPHAYELDPHRMIRADLARHQYATHRHMASLAPRPAAVIPDRHWLGESKKGIKRPDLVTVDGIARATAHEIELTPKKDRELDTTLGMHLAAIERGTYAEVIYVSPTKWLLERYARTLAHPDGLRLWHKGQKGWEAQSRRPVPKTLQAAFRWIHRPSITAGL